MAKIADYLSETEILAQLAEEAAELAQAALKLRRALDGTNPTPKSVDECRKALLEEYADTSLCFELMVSTQEYIDMSRIAVAKYERWLKRLQENGAPKENHMRYCPNCGAKMDMEGR